MDPTFTASGPTTEWTDAFNTFVEQIKGIKKSEEAIKKDLEAIKKFQDAKQCTE